MKKVLPQNAQKITTKILSFFRDYARKKWPLRGSSGSEHLMAHVSDFSAMSFA
jgi:hypothetical protein